MLVVFAPEKAWCSFFSNCLIINVRFSRRCKNWCRNGAETVQKWFPILCATEQEDTTGWACGQSVQCPTSDVETKRETTVLFQKHFRVRKGSERCGKARRVSSKAEADPCVFLFPPTHLENSPLKVNRLTPPVNIGAF